MSSFLAATRPAKKMMANGTTLSAETIKGHRRPSQSPSAAPRTSMATHFVSRTARCTLRCKAIRTSGNSLVSREFNADDKVLHLK